MELSTLNDEFWRLMRYLPAIPHHTVFSENTTCNLLYVSVIHVISENIGAIPSQLVATRVKC